MTCAFTLGLGAVFSLLPHHQQKNNSFHATDHTHAKAGVNGGAALGGYFVGLLRMKHFGNALCSSVI